MLSYNSYYHVKHGQQEGIFLWYHFDEFTLTSYLCYSPNHTIECSDLYIIKKCRQQTYSSPHLSLSWSFILRKSGVELMIGKPNNMSRWVLGASKY